MDPIQTDLERWHRDGDDRAWTRVVRALISPWRSAIERFGLAPDQVDDALQELFGRLLLSDDGGPPPALAPPECADPVGWRRRVLRNALIDLLRARAPRERAEEAVAWGLTPGAAKDLRARRRNGDVVAPRHDDEPDDPFEAYAAALDLGRRRAEVVAALPRLAVRRRVALAVALGIDATLWAEPLAAQLRESTDAVRARLAAVADGAMDPTLALYPEGLGAEPFRKTLERAVADLRALPKEDPMPNRSRT